MIPSLPPANASPLTKVSPIARSEVGSPSELEGVQKQFEQMLWAEMLSQSGLEDALTKSGGEAAAPFARYVVEAIAKDIAESHPLGLSASGPSHPAPVSE